VSVSRTSMAVLTSAALVAVGAVMLHWLREPVRVAAVAPPAIEQPVSQPVPIGQAQRAVAAPGRVEPSSEPIELALGLIGQLKAVFVAEGDAVHVGQMLAELDNGDQQARADAAAATVALRHAELDKLMNGARPEQRREAAARLDEALSLIHI